MLVSSKAVASASCYDKLVWWQRLYSWPFLFIHLSVLLPAISDFDNYFPYIEYFYIALGSTITLHILTWLVCQWSLTVDAFVTYRKNNDLEKAEFILVLPPLHQGVGSFCELIREKDEPIKFYFQKLKFVYNTDRKTFYRFQYPCEKSPTISDFQSNLGLTTSSLIHNVTKDFGLNKFDIPEPTFSSLFKEHAIAPFFVFQMFCVCLWFFDEFWYYSLFTLVMLIGFESTVVYQRLRTLNEFRSLAIPPFEILVYREKRWIPLLSDELLPARTTDDTAVPCDMIIMDGTAIVNEAMLTGESTPLLKESIRLREGSDMYNPDGIDKNHLLYGGTKILQVTPTSNYVITAPNGGCIALVLKTGFGTSQGKLVRTMVYSTERASANNYEAFLFILFLMVFAIAAAAYVWIEGTQNLNRKRSKLVLDCILIVTSVVPPELPMELSLAVNTSLIELSKLAIFCTEPFRIPFAGKLDICCFDKTGTLTSENLVVEGVAHDMDDLKVLSEASTAPSLTTFVLAAAHSLAYLPDGIVGDPMEKATLEAIDWNLTEDNRVVSKKQVELKFVRRFQFSSALKRMSTITRVYNSKTKQPVHKDLLISVKGAPETIQKMLTTCPKGYEQAYKYFSRRGNRVIALAYKLIPPVDDKKADKLHRDEIECDLTFAGFLIFHNPLKPDSHQAIKMLNESSHRVVMITGDNALTACHVAQEVEITERTTLIIDGAEGMLTCKSVDETISFTISSKDATLSSEIYDQYDLCLTGSAITLLEGEGQSLFLDLIHNVWVYARVSPNQKEHILSCLKNAGYTTLMCGDGTNDVGALKQAHIGVALLDGTQEDLDKIARRGYITRLTNMYEQQKAMALKFNLPEPAPPPALAQALGLAPQPQPAQANGRPARPPPIDAAALSEKLMGEMDDEVPVLKFGDASVASPFTSKLSSIMSVTNIIRQGRCTLVATTQMYKILALNCLISAYSLSVLYLEGIKYGDYQATISGMLLAVCFLCISKAKPLPKLSKERPQTNIFNPYIMTSVMGQFLIHIIALIYIVAQAKTYEEQMPVDLDGKFEPNLLNSAVFLISLSLQVSTFAINYQGNPFRESLQENTTLYYGLSSCGFIAFACATELFPSMNEFLSLVPFPADFRNKLVMGLTLDFGLAYVIELVAKFLFSNNQPKPITERRLNKSSN